MRIALFNIILLTLSVSAHATDCLEAAKLKVQAQTKQQASNVILADDFLKFDAINIIVMMTEIESAEKQRLIEALSTDMPERDFYLVQIQDEQYLVEMDMKLCHAKPPINLGAFEIIEE